MSTAAASILRERNHLKLDELCPFAVSGLASMLVRDREVFCDRVRKSRQGLVQEGVSPRYSAMTILGLHRWHSAGNHSAFSVAKLTDQLLADRSWIDNVGDLGLLLWTYAAVRPEAVDSIYNELQASAAITRLNAKQAPTMELAWFLTGLSYAMPYLEERARTSASAAAHQVYELLVRNQGESGFFGHHSAGQNLLSQLRSRIGSFADQVYPIYGLTQFAKVQSDDQALGRARECADAICATQGSLGQWWWHYHAGSGKVVQRYPVYSVHQDGMAPMALFAVGDAAGADYAEPIHKGLSWIYASNELGCDMRDKSLGVIWRNIHSEGIRRRTREALDLIGFTGQSTSDLRVLHECRPYHLGWLLYAFSGRK